MGKNRGKRKYSRHRNDEEYVSMPAFFARELIKQVVYNPNNSSAKKSYSYSLYDKNDIVTWLQSPSSSEQNLRNASIYMYLSSMHYQRLIDYYAGLPTGAYVISPLGYEGEVSNPANYIKQYYKTSKAIELMDIPSLIRQILIVALREGAFYGVRWGDKSSSFVQKIDADYCKITHIVNGSFLYSVDMTKLQGRLELYPAEFTTMYNAYLSTGERWQLVPPEICVCVKADETTVDYSVPPFAAVMPYLYTIANTEALQETASELKNYKMITGKVATDSRGAPLMGWDVYRKYYAQLANAVGDSVGLAVTPFDLDSFSFEEKGSTADVDEVSKTIGNFWASAGTSGLLHGMMNNTSGVTKLSIKNDETYIMGIVKQIEKCLNRYLRTSFSSTAKFKITILPVTVFNREEYVKTYKEAASFGIGKSYYAAALGIPQCDIAGLDYLERETKSFEALTPLKSSYTSSGKSDDSGEDVGRPKQEDLTESGEITRDADSNGNR